MVLDQEWQLNQEENLLLDGEQKVERDSQLKYS